MSLLEISNVAKSFGAIRAVNGISLTVDAGEVIGLMGDNGAGKSTMVKLIAGNFLRCLENWGGSTLNFKGSLVSLYYATYNTGVYKCCTSVYSPPTRNYSFDSDFTNPAGLPLGTPLFRDVDSLGYRQLFTARTN